MTITTNLSPSENVVAKEQREPTSQAAPADNRLIEQKTAVAVEESPEPPKGNVKEPPVYKNTNNPVLTVNKKFENLLPPLTPDEFAGLETSVLTEGIRDSIIVWKGKTYIVDGHNRYQLAMKHGIPFSVVEREFADEDAACIWILENQLGQRNLTDVQKSFRRGELYKLLKRKQGAPEGNKNASKQLPQNGGIVLSKASGETAERIAKSQNVSKATVERDAKFHTAVTDIAKITGHGENAIVAIAEKHGKTEVHRIDGMKPNQQKAVVEKLITNEAKSAIDARRIFTKEQVKNVLSLNSETMYRVLYADPPWRDGNISGSGAAENHYPTMSLDEICALEVGGKSIKALAQDNAVLFLWVTNPMLEKGFKVVESWGFDYKSSIVWDKVAHGLGGYVSIRHEHLLICTKGSCMPDDKKLFDSVQEIERSKRHSEKPEQFREIIDTLYPSGRRIELFARKTAVGWDAWGDEIEGIFHKANDSLPHHEEGACAFCMQISLHCASNLPAHRSTATHTTTTCD